MKFDRKWVEKMAQCPDGAAWGLEYVKDGGFHLHEAVRGFTRADFLLWFLVKTDVLPVEGAFDLLLDLAKTRLDDGDRQKVWIEGLNVAGRKELHAIRGMAACEAEGLMVLGQFRKGHAQTVITFLARMRLHILDVDLDEALKDGQCVLNNLVAADIGTLNFETPEALQEHKGLCEWLNTHVIVAGRRV